MYVGLGYRQIVKVIVVCLTTYFLLEGSLEVIYALSSMGFSRNNKCNCIIQSNLALHPTKKVILFHLLFSKQKWAL